MTYFTNEAFFWFCVGVLLMWIIMKFGPSPSQSQSQSAKDDAYITELMKQCARWAVASEQDENPLIAVLHANYASGYLWATNDIFSSSDIERVTGFKFHKIKDYVQKVQKYATYKATKVCPAFAPRTSVEIGQLSGEGVT